MPNGKPGDHPLTDMLIHGAHPFPADIEELLRQIHATKPEALNRLDTLLFDLEGGRRLDEGRTTLRQILERIG